MQLRLMASNIPGKSRVNRALLFALLVFSLAAVQALPWRATAENSPTQASTGPAKGALVIQGGGDILPQIWERFISLAGGPEANFVFIPTADDPIDPGEPSQDEFPTKRFKHVTVLHTRCRTEADTEAFIAPLRSANGVWFGGGRQWRLGD